MSCVSPGQSCLKPAGGWRGKFEENSYKFDEKKSSIAKMSCVSPGQSRLKPVGGWQANLKKTATSLTRKDHQNQ
jgi:hypothetical protein